MPLLSSRASGSVRAFGLTVLSALTSVLDLFTRADQSGLGTIKGQKWKVWRGVWAIVNNKASSSSTAGDNALATLKFTKTDVTVSIAGAEPGMGAAFWVTDANNWYASVYVQNEVCQTCSNCNSFSGGNCASSSGGTCNAFNPESCVWLQPGNCGASGTYCCAALTPGNCIVFNSANTGNRAPPYGFCHQPSGFNPPTCNAGFCCNGSVNTWSPYCLQFAPGNCNQFNPVVCNQFNPVVCNAFFTFSCNCVTEHRVSIIRSLIGTVSTLSSNLFSAAIQSFKTSLSGSQATIQAFSTNTYTSQIGNSITQSITSPQKTSQHGIIKSTSSFQQGSTIDELGVN